MEPVSNFVDTMKAKLAALEAGRRAKLTMMGSFNSITPR